MDNIKEIDNKKKILEVKYYRKYKSIYLKIQKEISRTFITQGIITSNEINDIIDKYAIDFENTIKRTFKSSFIMFGFSIRKELELKEGISFYIDDYQTALEEELEIKEDKLTREQNTEINKSLLISSTAFIKENTEKQLGYMLKTTEKEVKEGFAKGIDNYNNQITNTEDKIIKKTNTLNKEKLFALFSSRNKKKVEELEKDIINLNKELTSTRSNKNKIINDTFKADFNNKSDIRSELTSELQVGASESFSRESEAQAVNGLLVENFVIKSNKNWNATLDLKTREHHSQADRTYKYNPIPIVDYFIVGGEPMKHPRDLNASIGNIARCRCISEYSVEKVKLN